MTIPKIEYLLLEIEIPSLKKMIKVRQMLAKEEKLLLMAKSSPDETKNIDIQQAIKQVITNCIVTANIDVDSLTMFDIEFLFIKLRAFSATNILKLSYIDNDDNETHNFEVDLNKVDIKWPEKVVETLKVDNNLSIKLKYPDARLYTSPEFLKATNGNEAAELLMINCIDKVYDTETYVMSSEEMKTFINSLPSRVYSEMYEYIFNMPSVFYEIKYQNKNQKERSIKLQTLSEFFTLV